MTVLVEGDGDSTAADCITVVRLVPLFSHFSLETFSTEHGVT